MHKNTNEDILILMSLYLINKLQKEGGMTITSQHWHQIKSAFHTFHLSRQYLRQPSDLLNIEKVRGVYTFSVHIFDWNTHLFDELIGRRRLERICRRMNIQNDRRDYLTSENVHKIFLGMMDIRKEDVEEQRIGTIEEVYKKTPTL